VNIKMWKHCSAIARSTQEACKKTALRGSRYCWSHIDKTPIVVSVLAGVLAGYLLSWVLPSPELLELRALRSDVTPLLALAESSFPQVDRRTAVVELSQQVGDLRAKVQELGSELEAEQTKVRELESDAKKSARGITFVYDFQGNRRSTSPGRISVEAGAKAAEFKRIRNLHDAQRWQDLLAECQREMADTPEWLTPYMFAGVAHANLGNRTEAIRLLLYVKENAAGDPEYSQVDPLLANLGAR